MNEKTNNLRDKVRELYEKLERDPDLYKEFIKDENSFLINHGFDPTETKNAIQEIHKERIEVLKDVLSTESSKLEEK